LEKELMDSKSEHVAEPATEPEELSDGQDARLVGKNGRESSEGTERYERRIDLGSDSTHAMVVRFVGADQRVLELGPATGHMTRVLRDRGCSVVGIELDPKMAAEAEQYCERMIVGDLDELELDAELGSDRFDVVVAADVLEHLKDPLAALRRLRPFVASDGFFVISLPNVAHGSVRLALLEGHFSYQKVGLLDETHLRFFTRESIGKLLDEAELGVAEVHHQALNIDASEVSFDPAAVPAGVIDSLVQDPDAQIYQFVIKAIPLEAPGLREMQRRSRELAHENASLREAAGAGGREAQLRSALIDAHDQLLRRDEQINSMQEELQLARQDTASLHAQILRLRVRLDRILNSPPARAYDVLRGLPGLRTLVARRTASYQTAMHSAEGRPPEQT
jgi:O-antigen biosynthesis protein